jgi:hypothetical protein
MRRIKLLKRIPPSLLFFFRPLKFFADRALDSRTAVFFFIVLGFGRGRNGFPHLTERIELGERAAFLFG